MCCRAFGCGPAFGLRHGRRAEQVTLTKEEQKKILEAELKEIEAEKQEIEKKLDELEE